MPSVIISFRVDSNYVNKAIEAIQTFIQNIEENEPGTLLYKSFQSKDDPELFQHIMTFKNENAQQLHRNSDYCKAFVETLYPLCTEKPKPITCNEITV